MPSTGFCLLCLTQAKERRLSSCPSGGLAVLCDDRALDRTGVSSLRSAGRPMSSCSEMTWRSAAARAAQLPISRLTWAIIVSCVRPQLLKLIWFRMPARPLSDGSPTTACLFCKMRTSMWQRENLILRQPRGREG